MVQVVGENGKAAEGAKRRQGGAAGRHDHSHGHAHAHSHTHSSKSHSPSTKESNQKTVTYLAREMYFKYLLDMFVEEYRQFGGGGASTRVKQSKRR